MLSFFGIQLKWDYGIKHLWVFELAFKDMNKELKKMTRFSLKQSSDPKGRQVEPYTHIGKQRKPMNSFSRSYHG